VVIVKRGVVREICGATGRARCRETPRLEQEAAHRSRQEALCFRLPSNSGLPTTLGLVTLLYTAPLLMGNRESTSSKGSCPPLGHSNPTFLRMARYPTGALASGPKTSVNTCRLIVIYVVETKC